MSTYPETLSALYVGAAADVDAAAPTTTLGCACPSGPGRAVTDSAVHGAWHALVVDQGGPAGVVDVVSLRTARGFKTETSLGETVLDERARSSGRRASGRLREACR